MSQKFEKIIRGIEDAPPKNKEDKKEILETSLEEKSERLWAFWNEYRKKKYNLLLRERKKSAGQRKKLEEVEDESELVKLKNEIAELWQDKKMQALFKRHLQENLEEREEIKPDLESYHQQEKELEEIRKDYEVLLRDLFVHRGEEPDELTQIELAELAVKIDILKERLDAAFQENPELASFIQYETLKDYHSQLEENDFIWTASRQKLFSKILSHLVLLNKNRPMLLVGETGTGKTRLVRAAVKRLTDQPPFEIGEEAKSDIRPLLGSAAISQNHSYINYGPLGQAITGKKTSQDKESDGGGIFFMDEMNGYPPDALRSLIKQLAGRKPGEKVSFAAWRGKTEEIGEKSGLIGSANLPSEKHPDRPELPTEITRELKTEKVDYPEQNEENPELYEMLLAGLMDKNGRVRLKEGELEPAWLEEVDVNSGEKKKVLDSTPASGGTLWRFANLTKEVQKSYCGEENILSATKGEGSYLRTAVLDTGILLSWLREYRISRRRQGEPLKNFLQEKLRDWSGQKSFPEEDRDLLKEFFAAYDLPIDGPEAAKSDIRGKKIWSEKEIGFLSPRVPRSKAEAGRLKPRTVTAFLEDGTEIEYILIETAEQAGDLILKGKTEQGDLVIEDKITNTAEITTEEQWEKNKKDFYHQDMLKNLDDSEKAKRYLRVLIESAAESIQDADERKKYLEKSGDRLNNLSSSRIVQELKKILNNIK